MKKLRYLGILIISACSMPSIATSSALNISLTKTSRQKIKHPDTAMTDDQLNVILNRMRQKRNDEEKIAVLKSGVKGNGITVDQLIKLLNQFLTDSSKLNAAEYAYPYTVNYKSFLNIQDIFAQEPTKYELEDFLKKTK